MYVVCVCVNVCSVCVNVCGVCVCVVCVCECMWCMCECMWCVCECMWCVCVCVNVCGVCVYECMWCVCMYVCGVCMCMCMNASVWCVYVQGRRKGKKFGTARGRGNHPHRPGEGAGAEGGTPPDQPGGAGERCKLPHRGLGRSPRSHRVL